MIYNQACSHCRQKLRQGLRNAYSANSPTNERDMRRLSASSAPPCSSPQRPWLNERVLRAFDGPPPEFMQPSLNYGVYQTPGSTTFCPMDHIQSPDEAVEQVLQALECAIEAEEACTGTTQMSTSHCTNIASEPGWQQPDFLSPEARAQLQLFSEPEELSSEDWWAPPPPVHHDPTMMDFSISSGSSSVPSFPGSGHVSPLNCFSCSRSFRDPLSLGDEQLLDSLLARPPTPLPEPRVQLTAPLQRERHTVPAPRRRAPRKPKRTFKFVLEDVGGKAPIIQ